MPDGPVRSPRRGADPAPPANHRARPANGPNKSAKRPTIADIAKQAGVTKAAVSFALNGQPGVSADTRARVLDIARQIGWRPNRTARALSGGRAGAFGLVVDRPARTLGVEPWFMQLISGIQAELSSSHISLLFTVAEDVEAELEVYRAWWADRRVDGIFLVDLRVDDQRIAVLASLGLPTVVIGDPVGAGGLPAVWHDDVAAMRTVLTHLAELGHRRIARVSGIKGLWHDRIRDEAFTRITRELGLTGVHISGDYTGESGAAATEALLARSRPPTAIIYDNDQMAIAGQLIAQRAGRAIPTDLSIVSWEDSPLCELLHPALTVLHRDVVSYGAFAARHLMNVQSGVETGNVSHAAHSLLRRGSCGLAPSAAQR